MHLWAVTVGAEDEGKEVAEDARNLHAGLRLPERKRKQPTASRCGTNAEAQGGGSTACQGWREEGGT